MSLKFRIFGVLSLGLLCLGLLVAALAWQSLAHGRQQRADLLLQTQAYAWQQLETQQMQRLERLAAQLVRDNAGAMPDALEQRMRAVVRNWPGLRIDLLDAGAAMLATTAEGINPEPLLDPPSVSRWLRQQMPTQGLHQLSARQYHWLTLAQTGDHVLVLGQESVGLSEAARAACDDVLHIRQFGSTRSINAGAAAAIAMHAWVVQHA